MEAALQCIFPALQAVDRLKNCTVLTSIAELQVSTDIPSAPGSEFCVQVKADICGPSKHSSTLQVFSPSSHPNDALIEANGLIFTTLQDASKMNTGDREAPELCHELEWVIDITKTPWNAIVEHCQREAIAVEPLHLRQKCDPFCRKAIQETLLGLSVSHEQEVTGDRRHLLRWMRSVETEPFAAVGASADLKNMKIGAVGEAVQQMGSHLRDILLGDVNPLELALEKDLLYRCYLDDDNLLRCHAQMIEYLQLAQLKSSELRILEVGGGTGSLTVPLLRKLSESHGAKVGSYVFTDVSTHFIRHTKHLLEQWHSIMEFQKFDIEKAPGDQGLELNSFDYIIASNVVHVTSSLEKTLCNLRTLLKPGGALVFIEITNPSLRWGIFGGALPGWWLGVNDGRESSPLLCAERWDDALKAGGSSGLSQEMKDYESAEDHEMSVLIAINTPQPERVPGFQKIAIINTKQTVELSSMLKCQFDVHNDRFSVLQSHLSGIDANQDVYIILPHLSKQSYLEKPSETEWIALQKIVESTGTIVWVTFGATAECSTPHHAIITGLSRSLRAEKQQCRILTIDIDPESANSTETVSELGGLIHKILLPTFGTSFEFESEYVIRNGTVLIPRLMPNDTLNNHIQDTVSEYHPRLKEISHGSHPLRLRIRHPGLLDTIYWEHSQRDSAPLGEHEVQVAFEYIGVNFRDLMASMGQLGAEMNLLVEGSGTVLKVGKAAQYRFTKGDKVCAFGPDGLATISNLNMDHVFLSPSKLELSTSAAVLVAYLTALHCLRDVAHVKPGDSVLIHSAAGAVGQAAIVVARHLKAGKIFLTVSSQAKRDQLKEKFGIEDDDIFCSRDHTFKRGILLRTSNRGVDVVLNSLSGDALTETASILADFGRFVETGKRDLINNGRLEMKKLLKCITFAVVDLVLLAKSKPRVFRELITDALQIVSSTISSTIRPIDIKPVSELESTFRLMQAGKHVGKIVLKLDSASTVRVQPQVPPLPKLRHDSSYLVVGGTGGLGRVLVRHLTSLGAGQIITLSRSGHSSQEMRNLKQELSQSSTIIAEVQGSVSDRAFTQEIQDLTHDRPLSGIFQGAMTPEVSLSNSNFPEI
ncbi:unnamed protein product [Alternaria alternata]